MTDEIVKSQDFGQIESVLMTGDLSKLSSEQRVEYYNAVCKSTGINPLTRPFDYIQLNGKLTLYAKKDAADQLRKINDVSIDDVEITETSDTYFVKVKGHDKSGRTDVEIGVVKKSDMQGNAANAQMKAVTKAKRRLTLSICGLGWLDETEVETIPSAKTVKVDQSTGEIIEGKAEPEMTYEQAAAMTTPKGKRFDTLTLDQLNYMTEHGNEKQIEAAVIVLAHDFSAEAPTPETLPGMDAPKSGGLPD